jgi:subtilase family serine protease
VSGPASRIEQAFRTELHQYLVEGKTHFANTSEPSVPAAIAGMISSIHGLDDFRMRPSNRGPKAVAQANVGARYTSSRGNHYLAPDDLSTIYNIKPLFDRGIDASGQKLVVAGQTQIDLSDIRQFRSMFNLPANDPQVVLVPGSGDPGVVSSDVAEAHLDLEWSGAVARNATLIYVYSFDVMQAVQYAIDQNLAPVVSTSYGLCELEMSSREAASLRASAKQGNALGITWFSASGDTGAADCNSATHPGLAVDVPASIPEVTGVGGTEFNEAGGSYWNDTNDSNRASAISYIPETAWNDSSADGEPSAGGGGASSLFTRPSWQVGTGVPDDGARHVPDISAALGGP